MLKIAKKDKDYVFVYSDTNNSEELEVLTKHFNVLMSDTYEGCSAYVVRIKNK